MADAIRSDRARRDVERLRPEPGDPDAFFVALAGLLERHGLPFVGACWHLTDPVSGLFSWTGAAGELPGDFVSALENEFLEDDVAKYADLARRRRPVASLVQETGGHPAQSARYRRHLAPDGFADELRLAFVDQFGRWGSMGLFSDRPYAPEQLESAAELVPLVARALREGMALASTAPSEEALPGVLVLDRDDRVRTRDARAVELLAGCAATGSLPGVLHVLAARARATGEAARGRTLGGDGVWIAVDASPLLDEPGGVSVVLRPAPAPSVLDVRLRAAGLTEREREIARLVLRGDDTAAIAAALHLSPWTVQDHLKSIFDKTGVRSRRAFVARWALSAAGVD
jgi:DNA-binding CsgD family transcriptional regulator